MLTTLRFGSLGGLAKLLCVGGQERMFIYYMLTSNEIVFADSYIAIDSVGVLPCIGMESLLILIENEF